MNHKLKRFVQKVAVKSMRLLDHTQDDREHKSEYERDCISICKALINQEDTTLLMSPLSNKRFIRSADEQLFIIIEARTITIVNHQYSYTIDVWGKAHQHVIDMFDVEVEKRRNEMEMEIRSNVKHSLSNIYKTLTHAQKTAKKKV